MHDRNEAVVTLDADRAKRGCAAGHTIQLAVRPHKPISLTICDREQRYLVISRSIDRYRRTSNTDQAAVRCRPVNERLNRGNGRREPLHIAIILLIVLLVFGAKKLPEMGRRLDERSSHRRGTSTEQSGVVEEAKARGASRPPSAPLSRLAVGRNTIAHRCTAARVE